MRSVYTYLDATMCMLWIITYTLVLIGTVKYRHPLISPMTQAITAPFEWSVLFLFHKIGSAGLNYGFIAYLYWAIVELAIFRVIEKLGYIKKTQVKPYIIMVCTITLLMFQFVVFKEKMFFFSYFNTFVGMLFWLWFVQTTRYPLNRFTFILFCVKFLADILGMIVYYGDGMWLISAMSVMLPAVDFLFIIYYFKEKKNRGQKECVATAIIT